MRPRIAGQPSAESAEEFPSGLLVDGQWISSGEAIPVIDKFSQTPFAWVQRAQVKHVDAAVAAAAAATTHTFARRPRPRYETLRRAADHLDAQRDRIVRAYVAETGFTIRDGRTEHARACNTLLLCAEEATRLTGETVPLAASAGSEDRIAFTLRVPVGVVCAIGPFNAPLNTIAQKVGSALAAGNAVVLKPATTTPLSSALLCEALLAAGLPDGFLNMVVGPGSEVGEQLLQDRRIRYFTFTGSTRAGLLVKQRSGIAKTHLELGSNSVTIVCADADLELAAELITRSGFRKAGQVCTSVQRVLVDGAVAGTLAERIADRIGRLVVGDPHEAATDVGPMISIVEAERALAWVNEAVSMGATLLTGGRREGAILWPTLLTDVPTAARVMRDEVFAPVVALSPFATVGAAVEAANSTAYGLQAGVFTRDVDLAFHLARRLEVGGVMINDTSSYHADGMPFGGVKDSGYGVEGPRYAVMDMTDSRVIVLNLRSVNEEKG